ncbi:MAG: hypothetical protein V3U84_11235 [Thiotrichaceae bacterium]
MDSEFKLYLYPEKPDYQADLSVLISLLKNLKFLGKSLSQHHYAVGDNFLSLLTFMGCSPDIELEPQDNKPYCYIEVDSFKRAQFISGINTKYPPCPHCKEKLNNRICSNCNETLDAITTNWRKSAFISQCWICIGNIYELEAIPGDLLLMALEKETGIKWKPAYIRRKPIT